MKVTRLHWLLGILGTLILGALGSGLWELAIKPVGEALVRSTLTLVSFGSEAMKDVVYREAAKGTSDVPIILAIMLLMIMVGVRFVAGYFESFREARRILLEKDRSELSEEQILQMKARLALLKRRLRWTLRSGTIMGYLIVAALGLNVIILLRASESSSARTFFEMSMSVCRPYIDEHQSLLIRSRFAQVKTRAEYVAIIADLRTIAKSSGQHLLNMRSGNIPNRTFLTYFQNMPVSEAARTVHLFAVKSPGGP